MIAALQLIQILLALVLIGIILLQVRMQGLGGVFGGGSSTVRVRRGLEKTLFQFTIGIAIVFVLLSIVSVMVQR